MEILISDQEVQALNGASASEYVVYLRLLQRRDKRTGTVCIGRDQIVKDTGKSLSSVKNALRCLRKRGLLRRLQRPTLHNDEFKTNVYWFPIHEIEFPSQCG